MNAARQKRRSSSSSRGSSIASGAPGSPPMSSPPFDIRQLTSADLARMGDLLTMFGEAFEEEQAYSGARPGAAYLERLLGSDTFIALVASKEGEIVGGIAAYELPKFEQERSEIYLYDLAVASSHRRQGVATALIEELKRIAASRGAWVVFVQADAGDEPAIALYSKLGRREDVHHFDLLVER